MMHLNALFGDESGASLTEYGVLMASFTLIFLSALVAVSTTANTVLQNLFNGGTAIQQCPPGTTGC